MRWPPSRKAAVLRQISDGAMTAEEAARRYEISTEELAEWQTALDQHGVPGLRVTRMQIYTRRKAPGSRRWERP